MTPSFPAALPVERHQVLSLWRWPSVRHGAVGVAVPQLLHEPARQQAYQQPERNQNLNPHSIPHPTTTPQDGHGGQPGAPAFARSNRVPVDLFPRPRARVATGTATTSEGSSRTARLVKPAGGDPLGLKPDPLTTAQTAVCVPCLEAGLAVVTFSPLLQ